MKPLTQRQREALEAVAFFWKQGRPPTTGELLARLGLATESGLSDLLRPLREKGCIEVHGGVRGRQRLIELTSRGRAEVGFGVPVLGEIPAGPLREAVQEANEWVEGAGALLRVRSGDFFLRVRDDGDSMTGAGILPGDLVLLRPDVEVRSGEIVAAQICEDASGRVEATLKHLDFLPDKRTVRLRAANPAYPDREFDAACVRVAGAFRGLVRSGD
jgi:repressor LexA